MSKNQKIFSNGEINVSLIISLIKTRFVYLLSFIFASLIISVFIIKIQTQLYKTNISFTPSSSDPSTGVNDIMDLASTVGINLGTNSTHSFNITDIVNSRWLQDKIILSKYIGDQNINLIQYWEIDTNKNNIIKKALSACKNMIFESPIGLEEDKWLVKAREELENRIIIEEGESGLITINVWMEEPDIAIEVANNIKNQIEEYVSDVHLKYAAINKQNIQDRIDDQMNVRKEVQNQLSLFIDENKKYWEDAFLLEKYKSLYAEVEIQNQVYITLKQQYELAAIEEKKQNPAVVPLDSPNTPVSIDKPDKLLTILFISILGFIMGLSIIIYRNDR